MRRRLSLPGQHFFAILTGRTSATGIKIPAPAKRTDLDQWGGNRGNHSRSEVMPCAGARPGIVPAFPPTETIGPILSSKEATISAVCRPAPSHRHCRPELPEGTARRRQVAIGLTAPPPSSDERLKRRGSCLAPTGSCSASSATTAAIWGRSSPEWMPPVAATRRSAMSSARICAYSLVPERIGKGEKRCEYS